MSLEQARVWGRCGCACDSVGGGALIGSEMCWVPGVVFPMCLQSKLTLLYLQVYFRASHAADGSKSSNKYGVEVYYVPGIALGTST